MDSLTTNYCVTGWDEIYPKIIKFCCSGLITPLAHICKLVFSFGTLAAAFKKLKIVHFICKNGPINDVNNYRPLEIKVIATCHHRATTHSTHRQYRLQNNSAHNHLLLVLLSWCRIEFIRQHESRVFLKSIRHTIAGCSERRRGAIQARSYIKIQVGPLDHEAALLHR